MFATGDRLEAIPRYAVRRTLDAETPAPAPRFGRAMFTLRQCLGSNPASPRCLDAARMASTTPPRVRFGRKTRWNGAVKGAFLTFQRAAFERVCR